MTSEWYAHLATINSYKMVPLVKTQVHPNPSYSQYSAWLVRNWVILRMMRSAWPQIGCTVFGVGFFVLEILYMGRQGVEKPNSQGRAGMHTPRPQNTHCVF